MCEPLERARKLFGEMDFSQFVEVPEPDHYTMDGGHFHGRVAYRDGGIEVMHVKCEPGTEIEPHTHEQIEHLLLYSGDAVVTISGVETTLQNSQSVNIPPLTLHSLTSENGCRMIIIRVPPVKGLY